MNNLSPALAAARAALPTASPQEIASVLRAFLIRLPEYEAHAGMPSQDSAMRLATAVRKATEQPT
jgi:hypothetical protein